MKVISYIIFILMIIIVVTGCGLPDYLFIQEPENLYYDSNYYRLVFDAYNQEKYADDYILIGYDVYYSFNASSGFKKAMVQNPSYKYYPSSFLIDYLSKNNDIGDDEYLRFENFDEIDIKEIYRIVSIPVTYEMISQALYEGNSENVYVYFDNSPGRTKTPYLEQIAPKRVEFVDLYPAYEDYDEEDWGEDDPQFLGFYDKDYYQALGISPTATDEDKYIIYFYVQARAFNGDPRALSNIITSEKTPTVAVTIEVATGSDNN